MVPRDRAQRLVRHFRGCFERVCSRGRGWIDDACIIIRIPVNFTRENDLIDDFSSLGRWIDESPRLLIISWPSTRGWLKSRSALEAISITNEGRGIIIVNRNLYLNFARMSNKEGTMLSFLSSYLRERIVDRRIVVVFTRFTFQSVGKILKF